MASKSRRPGDKTTQDRVVEGNPMGRVVEVVRDGDWLAPEDLRGAAIEAAAANVDLAVNLEGVEYLDGSTLQTLLALVGDQGKRERKVVFVHASPALRQWFDLAGAGDKFQFA